MVFNPRVGITKMFSGSLIAEQVVSPHAEPFYLAGVNISANFAQQGIHAQPTRRLSCPL
jgi:hypothetical protein